MTAKTKSAATNATETVTKTYEEAMTASKKGVDTAAKAYEDLISFNRDAMEALMKAGTRATKAAEEINAEVLSYNKVAFDDGVAAAKAVMSAKTVQEAIDLQTGWMKASFDSYMAQATKMGELTAKTTQEVFEPVNTRFTAFVEKAVKPVTF